MATRPITYRDLRNTPGRVFERLAEYGALPLVADGTTKAVLIPVEDGDAATALEAWRRGRGLLALSRLHADARRSDESVVSRDVIDAEIRAVRRARRERESDR